MRGLGFPSLLHSLREFLPQNPQKYMHSITYATTMRNIGLIVKQITAWPVGLPISVALYI